MSDHVDGRVRILPSGERAVLAEVADAVAAHALAAHVRATGGDALEEVVPGARTVLVVVRDAALLGAARELLRSAPAGAADAAAGAEVSIDVVYDGADLQDVARATGLDEAEVVRRHTHGKYRVEFVGFAPGFAYLTGLDPSLQLPRLATPRPHVPAGSVAIAGGYTAVYPRSSPGGWRLLGRTDAVLFDLDADPVTPLTAGTRVRFVAR